jgi:hypothetical protein
MRKSLLTAAGLASVAVLAVTGIASATGSSTGRSPARQSATEATISQADAGRAALTAVPGSTVTETRLDTDNGRTVWNVHLSTPSGALEVKVDAETGEARVDDLGVDGSGHDANDDHRQGNDRHGNDR